MAKRVQSEREIALRQERTETINERDRIEKELDRIWHDYCNLEGSHGRIAYSPWDCGQGLRGFHYEYAPGAEEVELAERRKLLEDNDYEGKRAWRDELNHKIWWLDDEICKEQYGMDLKARRLQQSIKRLNTEIADLQKLLADRKKELEEYLKGQ